MTITPENYLRACRHTSRAVREIALVFCALSRNRQADRLAAAVAELARRAQEKGETLLAYLAAADEEEVYATLEPVGIGWQLTETATLLARRYWQARVADAVEQARTFVRTRRRKDQPAKGIGPKIARMIVLAFDPDAPDYAVLDTHILRFLRAIGHDAPTTTPGSASEYERWEEVALREIRAWFPGRPLVDADLAIWQLMSGRML